MAVIYKFRAFNKSSIELIVNKELWFAQASSLNDPFECPFEQDLLFDGLNDFPELSEDRIKKIKQDTQDAFSRIGICSFSRTQKNQLMWAHYADEHRGFCLGFDELSLKEDTVDYIQSVKVEYQAHIPNSSVMSGFSVDPQKNEIVGQINTAAFVDIIGTKYTSWSYEREQRLITPNFKAVKFCPQALKSIAFGLRMTERDKQTLKQLLSGPEWQHVKWYQAKKVPQRFSLEFGKIKI